MAGWSDDELREALKTYLEMFALADAETPYSKAAFRRRTLPRLKHRTAVAYEYRMRNISAVLVTRGEPFIPGYAPATQVGKGMRVRINKLIDELRSGATSGGPRGQSENAAPPTLDAQPVIYFNIGWMDRYQGTSGEASTHGNHGYLKTHNFGAETFNFEQIRGRLYGYRPTQGALGIRLEQLGAAKAAGSLDGVLVVWMAREPVSKRTYVVGWYRNATIYRRPQQPVAASRSINGETILYSAAARAIESRLLPVAARQFQIRSNKQLKGGFGQNTIWYGTADINARVKRFISQIESGVAHTSRSTSKKPPRNNDPELRRRVEKAAVEHATKFYRSAEGGRCRVESVEILARGWDLEVERKDGSKLFVEVKGLQGSKLVCELTPNEYKMMNHENHRVDYVVYVVCNALTQPTASVFSHEEKSGHWFAVDGRELKVIPRTGAVLTCE